jgi:hypothetical protein
MFQLNPEQFSHQGLPCWLRRFVHKFLDAGLLSLEPGVFETVADVVNLACQE